MNRHVTATNRSVGLLLLAMLPGLAADAAQDVAGESQRLRARGGAGTAISIHPATGVARFVRVAPGSTASLSPLSAGSAEAKAEAFFREHAGLFGIRDAGAELRLRSSSTDKLGMTHLVYDQLHAGVPVFAGGLRAHFDAAGRLQSVNGVFVPGLRLDVSPSRSAAAAGRAAVDLVTSQKPSAAELAVRGSALFAYRADLVRGVPGGADHLVHEVQVGNGRDVREFVYVDAHNGKVVDQVSGIHEALHRTIYDGGYGPPFLVWDEGDPFPTGNVDIDNIIAFSGDTYDMYFDTFGRDSYDGLGHVMESVNDDPTIGCPNANWNGTSTNYCTGVTGDDTVAHEWTHAYTEYTHNLIYAWQPGALNESYSDIYGEIVDVVNGPNLPDNPRTADECSQFGGTPLPTLTITGGTAPGTYFAVASVNEPPLPFIIGPTAMAIVATDPPFQPTGACGAVSGVAGNIAIIDWTLNPNGTNECGSATRATNALNAGAVGIIFIAPPAGLLNLGSIAAIASVQVTFGDGATIKGGLPADATIEMTLGTDNSYRWLSGEDDPAFGGAIRDLWNPNCFGDPGRVDDLTYACGAADGGGVHTNSGVPNHNFALLVDGGTYNGQTVGAIGMTKAAHIYFRAMTVYQGPASDFVDHADALEQSCADLIGQNLIDLFGGPPQVLSAADCAEVTTALLATSMRTLPTQCNFQPLLDTSPAPLCGAGDVGSPFFSQSFENDPFVAGWTATTGPTSPDFTPRAWTWVNSLPNRPGSGVFAVGFPGGSCTPGDDESGVIQLNSPAFPVPSSAARLSFDHSMSSEATFDGGNLKISVNGGPFTVVPGTAYTFNTYVGGLAPPPNNTNPMAGEEGFSGGDAGTVEASAFGTSVIDLTGIAAAGDTVRLRFDFGQDGCTALEGWYVDNLSAYSCQPGGGVPGLSIGDVTLAEGNAGTTDAFFTVTLNPPDPNTVTVDFQTFDGTATTADNDYQALNGTIVFGPNETLKNITISVVGDTIFEADETFTVSLSNATGASIADGEGLGTILNDDKPLAVDTRGELVHDSRESRDLDSISKFWRISQKAHSSYEVIVDAVTGDIVGAGGPDLLRLDADGSTVLQTAGPATSGSSKSLRFENASATSNDAEFIRVRSAGCGPDCDGGDTFRIRAYDTTYRMSRFNNSASQITVVVIANPTDQPVTGTLWFYDATGNLATSQAVTIVAKGTFVLNTSTVVSGAGSATFSNDAAYGALTGKGVAVEPATGFTFDTAMVTRAAATKMVPRDN